MIQTNDIVVGHNHDHLITVIRVDHDVVDIGTGYYTGDGNINRAGRSGSSAIQAVDFGRRITTCAKIQPVRWAGDRWFQGGNSQSVGRLHIG